MKNSFLILIAVVLALLAAAIAPMFKTDPGMVQIQFRGWTIETSVLILILAVLALWLMVWVAVRLWKAPAETARRIRERRSLAQLEKGLLALTEGDWSTAERALEKSASSHGRTTARYLAAAEAADGQDAGDRAEWYLEQADTRNRKQKFLVDLTRARILNQNGNYAEAKEVLEPLLKRRRRHPQVLEMLASCYQELGDWDDLLKLLPAMQKAKVIDEPKAAEIRDIAAVGGLQHCKNQDELEAGWRVLPRPMKKSPSVVRAFAEKAVQIGSPELAEPVIRASLKDSWIPELLIPYGEPGTDDTSKRLKQCEKWLLLHPDDALLHLALGRLCARDELWGKARHHMIRSLEIAPSVAGYDSLGQLLERKGEMEIAMACFRNALRMNQGKEPLPLPSDHAKLESPESPDPV
jgi:HemY protein